MRDRRGKDGDAKDGDSVKRFCNRCNAEKQDNKPCLGWRWSVKLPDVLTRLREIAAGPDEGFVARAAVVDLAHDCLEEIERLRKTVALLERCNLKEYP